MSQYNFDNLDAAGREALRQEWRRVLESDPRFVKLTAGYKASSVSSWLDYFTEEKLRWLERLERNEKYYEDAQITWLNQASLHMEVILQKKLFDMQCRWRADQVKLKEVGICFDFELWEKDVLNCPFIEPVTGADIELYQQYLKYEDAEPNFYYAKGCLQLWQDYDEVKKLLADPDGEVNLPPWYQYHNQFTGAGMLLHTLPDTRGLKEEYYRQYARDAYRQAQQPDAENQAPTDDRPLLFFFRNEAFLDEVLASGPEQVRRARKLYNWSVQYVDEQDDIMYMTNELLRAEEPVPVEAHANWYEALKETSRKYRCRMIAEALPHALEQYQINIQMGIGFPRNEKEIENWMRIRSVWMESLMKGRQLLGEPEDTDF